MKRFRPQRAIAIGLLLLVVLTGAAFWLAGREAKVYEPSVQAQSMPEREPARENAVRIARSPLDLPGPVGDRPPQTVTVDMKIGRASCRERVEISVVGGAEQKQREE